jgi:hypothetical protein
MAYDPQTVLNRYQQMLDIPEGDPEGTHCSLMQRRARSAKAADASPRNAAGDSMSELDSIVHDTLGCDPGGCRSCCIGMVEVVRQFTEGQAAIETRAIEFDDITTRAAQLDDPSTRRP